MKKSTSCFAWPFVIVWNILTTILGLTGRLIAGVLGLALMIVGIVLTVLVVTAPVGIPLIVFGLLLIIRSIF
jgi:hypothetical protein